MTTISHYPHSLNTKYYAVLLYRNGNPISFVCRRYKCSKASLMRWNKKFDGSKESLIDNSHRPLSKHPNAHTKEELYWIKNYIRRNPNISLCELYGKLRVEKGYSRHACSLFRIVRKLKYPINTEYQKNTLLKNMIPLPLLESNGNWTLKSFLSNVILVNYLINFINILLLMRLHVKDLFILIKNNLHIQQ